GARLGSAATEMETATDVAWIAASDSALNDTTGASTAVGSISARVAPPTSFSDSDTAAAMLSEPLAPAATPIEAATTVEDTCAASIALSEIAPSEPTSDMPITAASVTRLLMLWTSAPAPAPVRATLPLPATDTAADTPRAVIEASERAVRVTPVSESTVAPSMRARVAPPRLFSAKVPATARLSDGLLAPATLTEIA